MATELGSIIFPDDAHYAKRSKKERLKAESDGERVYYNVCPYLPQHFFRLLIAAKTGTGKTHDLLEILTGKISDLPEEMQKNFTKEQRKINYWNPFDNVILCYKQMQPKYETLLKSLKDQKCNFISLNHMPTCDEFATIETALKEDHKKGLQSLLIFDDLMSSIKKSESVLEDIFTRFSHHYGTSIIMISQAVTQGASRVMRTNMSYYLIKDLTLRTAFGNLIDQAEVNKEVKKILKKKYEQVIKDNRFGSIILDDRCTQLGMPWLRYRVNNWFTVYFPEIDRECPIDQAEELYHEIYDSSGSSSDSD